MMSILSNKIAIIAIALLATIGVSVGVMASHGYGPFAFISYKVQGEKEAQIIPAHFDLGKLSPGEKGTIQDNATIVIKDSGNYTIALKHVEKLKKVFSEFNITITIASSIIKLNLDNTKYTLFLMNGTYTVNIVISYVVSQHPKSEDVKNEPLLIIHPAGEEDQEED
jgi:hypothetical protein